MSDEFHCQTSEILNAGISMHFPWENTMRGAWKYRFFMKGTFQNHLTISHKKSKKAGFFTLVLRFCCGSNDILSKSERI